MTSSGHIAQLDGLRAFAVMAVILEHTLPKAASTLSPGFFGVRLFFVISGFLITRILLGVKDSCEASRTTRIRALWIFYARRFLRIFPLYYFVLLAGALIGIGPIRAQLLWHLPYLSNVYLMRRGNWSGCTSHFWSLAVEEQFYLFWPLIVLCAPRRWLPGIFIGAVLSAIASRLWLYQLTANELSTLLTPCCLDTLGFGALLGYLQRPRESGNKIVRAFANGALVVGIALSTAIMLNETLVGDSAHQAIRIALADTAAALLSVWLVNRASSGFGSVTGAILEYKPVVYLGSISYGIYVYHLLVPPVVGVIEDRLDIWLRFPATPGFPLFLCVSAITIMFASCSWHLLESPCNGLKSFFPYSSVKGSA